MAKGVVPIQHHVAFFYAGCWIGQGIFQVHNDPSLLYCFFAVSMNSKNNCSIVQKMYDRLCCNNTIFWINRLRNNYITPRCSCGQIWCLPNYNNLGNFLAIILIGRGQLKSGWNTVSPIILIPNFPCVSNTFVSLFILEFGYVWE
jgi:hypothetical protein